MSQFFNRKDYTEINFVHWLVGIQHKSLLNNSDYSPDKECILFMPIQQQLMEEKLREKFQKLAPLLKSEHLQKLDYVAI